MCAMEPTKLIIGQMCSSTRCACGRQCGSLQTGTSVVKNCQKLEAREAGKEKAAQLKWNMNTHEESLGACPPNAFGQLPHDIGRAGHSTCLDGTATSPLAIASKYWSHIMALPCLPVPTPTSRTEIDLTGESESDDDDMKKLLAGGGLGFSYEPSRPKQEQKPHKRRHTTDEKLSKAATKLRKITSDRKEWRDRLLAAVNGKEKNPSSMNSAKLTASDHLKASSNYLQLGNKKKAQEEMQLYEEKAPC